MLAIDAALAKIPHAFGGALALAYYAEPRATIDIDLNLFIPTNRFLEVTGPLSGSAPTATTPPSPTSCNEMASQSHVGRDPHRLVLRL